MTDDLRLRLDALTAEVERLRAELGASEPEEPPVRASRRNLLKLAAATAAGAGATSLLSASPASAADGDLQLGTTNGASDTTTLNGIASPTLSLGNLTNGGAATTLAVAAAPGVGSTALALTGSSGGGTVAVVGSTVTQSTGLEVTMTGGSSSGVVAVVKGTRSTALAASDQSGDPDSTGLFATSSAGTAINAGVGGLGVAVAASATNGNAVSAESTAGYAFSGVSSATALYARGGAGGATIVATSDHGVGGSISTSGASATAIEATASGASSTGVSGVGTAVGVTGQSQTDSAVGVQGLTNGTSGIAVQAEATGDTSIALQALATGASSTGVVAKGSMLDLDAAGSGQIHLKPSGLFGPPTGDSVEYATGTQLVDRAGDLYHCVEGGAPATWVKLDHPTPGYSGGGFNVLKSPSRLLDTRPGATGATLHPGQPIGANSNYRITVGGTKVYGKVIPSTATGVVLTVTGIATTADPTAYLLAYPTTVALPVAVSLVTPTTTAVSSQVTTALVGGAFRIYANAVPIDVVVDLVGFYA